MPWIKVYSPVLNQNQKKDVATRLVETICNTLKVPKEMAGVEFAPYQPENVFWQGGFYSEKKGEHMYHLEVTLPPVTPEQKNEIYRTLTNTFSKALNLTEQEQHGVSMCLHELPMGNFAVGGRPVTEQLPAQR